MSEFSRSQQLTAAMLLSGGLVLTGCAGSPAPCTESSASTTHAPSPTPTKASLSPNVAPVTGHVDPNQVGALLDQALNAADEVDDTIADPSTIDKAYNDAARIPNAQVSGLATTLINWRLAENTKYVDSNLYIYSDNALDSDKQEVSKVETVVAAIRDVSIKAAALKTLNYAEAKEALVARTNNQAPQVAAYLTSRITSPVILAEMHSKPDGIADALTTDADNVETAESSAWSAVYDGSNSHADTLNKEIAALNSSRSKITG